MQSIYKAVYGDKFVKSFHTHIAYVLLFSHVAFYVIFSCLFPKKMNKCFQWDSKAEALPTHQQ